MDRSDPECMAELAGLGEDGCGGDERVLRSLLQSQAAG